MKVYRMSPTVLGRFKGELKCAKCGLSISVGDEVVSLSKGSRKNKGTKHYHTACYLAMLSD